MNRHRQNVRKVRNRAKELRDIYLWVSSISTGKTYQEMINKSLMIYYSTRAIKNLEDSFYTDMA